MHRPVGDAYASAIDASSEVYAGGSLTFYSLADVLQDVYTDTDYVTEASTSGVLTLDAAGRPPLAFFDHTLDYKAILKDADGATVKTINPIHKAAGFLTSASLTPYLPKAGGTLTGPINFAEGSAITAASAIDLDAATGNFVHITGATGISTMTLAQGAMRWLVFDGAPTLTHSANLLLGGADITAHAGMVLIVVGEGSGVTRLIGGMTASGKSIVESVAVTIGIGDQTTAITTGTNKRRWRAPFAFTVTAIRAALASAQASGANLVTVDVNNAGNSMLSTKITLDNNETSSTTAATAAVLDASYVSVADDGLIAVDIDNCDGSTTAAGLDVTLIGYKINAS